jgi:uncharacterized protein YuzE
MKITYDSDADAMYIELKKAEVDKTKEIDLNTKIDYDKQGNLIGIEILFVKERMPHLLDNKNIKIEEIINHEK